MAVSVSAGAAGWIIDPLIKELPDKNRKTQQLATQANVKNIFALEKDHFVINPYPSRRSMAIDWAQPRFFSAQPGGRNISPPDTYNYYRTIFAKRFIQFGGYIGPRIHTVAGFVQRADTQVRSSLTDIQLTGTLHLKSCEEYSECFLIFFIIHSPGRMTWCRRSSRSGAGRIG